MAVRFEKVGYWRAAAKHQRPRRASGEARNRLLEFAALFRALPDIADHPDAPCNRGIAAHHLVDIDLDLPRGSVVGVLDVDGGTRATLLRIAAGLEAPRSGRVGWHGRIFPVETSGLTPFRFRTLAENLRLRARALGLSDNEIREALERVRGRPELAKALELPAYRVPRKELFEVALAAACHLPVDIIVIPDMRKLPSPEAESWQAFVEAARARGACIMVGARKAAVHLNWTTHLVLIEGGRIKDFGPTETMVAEHSAYIKNASRVSPRIGAKSVADDDDDDDSFDDTDDDDEDGAESDEVAPVTMTSGPNGVTIAMPANRSVRVEGDDHFSPQGGEYRTGPALARHLTAYVARIVANLPHLPLVGLYLVRRVFDRTMMGYWWIALRALMPVAAMSVVFTHVDVFQSANIPYPVFLLSGMALWIIVDVGIGQGIRALFAGRRLQRMVPLPGFLFPVASLALPLIHGAVLAVSMIAAGVAFRLSGADVPFGMHRELALLPVFITLVAMLVTGISAFISVAYMLTRDIRFMVPVLTQAWFFATPVFYPLSALPVGWQQVSLYLNPLSPILEASRYALFGTGLWSTPALLVSAIVIGIVFLAGVWFMMRSEWVLPEMD